MRIPVQIKFYNRNKLMAKDLAIMELIDVTFTWVAEEKEWCLEFTLFNFGIMIAKSDYEYN